MRRTAGVGILGVIIALLSSAAADAQLLIQVNKANQVVRENYNGLANTGTSNNSSSVPNGSIFLESPGNVTFAADNGLTAGGNTYSYGTAGTTERAFGELTSASVQSTLGLGIYNNTGATIPSVLVAYTGEEWRSGQDAGTLDRLDFQYGIGSPPLLGAGYVDFNPLDFATPANTGTAVAKDGNAAANRTLMQAEIPVNLADNQGLTFRWRPVLLGSNNDDGLAIDDITVIDVQDDADGEGVPDEIDNCDNDANPDQANNDNDALGDACDFDDDNDGDFDSNDNCTTVANADQADTDQDGQGDVCDSDDDADGLLDASDQCPTVTGPPTSNGCPAPPPSTPDFDSDGVADAVDNCVNKANPDQVDLDADGEGDECDADDDADGVVDASDQCPQVTGAIENRGCPVSALPPDTSACDAAKAKLAKAKAKLKNLRAHYAPKGAIAKAKKRVKKAKRAVKVACTA
jgi:hypothetical protein